MAGSENHDVERSDDGGDGRRPLRRQWMHHCDPFERDTELGRRREIGVGHPHHCDP